MTDMHAKSNVVTKLLPSLWLVRALAREERDAKTAIQLHVRAVSATR